MMARAERERGFDLKTYVVFLHLCPVMRTMHKEAPSPHGSQSFERRSNPILLVDARKNDGSRCLRAGGTLNQSAHVFFMRRMAEIDFDHPGDGFPILAIRHSLERRGGCFRRIISLDDNICDAARGVLVALKAHEMGGFVGRQTFEHGGG